MFGEFLNIIVRSLKLDKSLYKESKYFGEAGLYFAGLIMILDGVAGAVAGAATGSSIGTSSGDLNLKRNVVSDVRSTPSQSLAFVDNSFDHRRDCIDEPSYRTCQDVLHRLGTHGEQYKASVLILRPSLQRACHIASERLFLGFCLK